MLLLMYIVHGVAETSCEETRQLEHDGNERHQVTGNDVNNMSGGMLRGRVVRRRC